jgi:predicted ester cyclase
MSSDSNEAILRRYVDQLNRRNFAVLDDVVADEVIFGPNETVSREQYRHQILDRIERMLDYHVTIDDLWTEGDEVSILWTYRGTDNETSQKLTGHVASAYRFVNCRIVEVRSLEGRLRSSEPHVPHKRKEQAADVLADEHRDHEAPEIHPRCAGRDSR